ncbi:hypothetical protein BA011_36490 (plasmid) [Rhizobium leguminosarum]|uniref:Uncharacterized protein n=1 Tax=Rhizobium leguminosarum TaxID=384 RepID=A0A1B1CPA7_RHILE|nr:hypothetical protein BA011_36490 [Rhizobium leguminosarum]
MPVTALAPAPASDTAKSQQYRLLLSRLGVSCNSFAGLGVSCPLAPRFPRACRTTLLGARRFGSVLRPAQPIIGLAGTLLIPFKLAPKILRYWLGRLSPARPVGRSGFAGRYGGLPVVLIAGLVLVALQLIDSCVFGGVLDCLLGGRSLGIIGHDDLHCCALLDW